MSMASNGIDDLRDEVLLRILSILPTTKQRAATSLVSRRWRHLWTHVSSLDFRRVEFRSSSTYHYAIYDCLRRFSRPLHGFSADDGPFGPHELRKAHLMQDRWIDVLSTTSLRVLSLNACALIPSLELPPSVLSLAPSLRVLQLYDLDLTGIDWAAAETPHRRGFQRLDTLVLDNVAIRQDQFRALLAACPLLENLRVYSTQLSVNLSSSVNPLLKKVYVNGDIKEMDDLKPFQVTIDLVDLEMLMLAGEAMRDFHLAGSPQLREVGLYPEIAQKKMPATLSGVQIMSANSLVFLVEYEERQEFAFPNLKVLYGSGIPQKDYIIYTPQPNSFVPFLSFLNRCPSLDTLYVSLFSESESVYGDVELDKLGAVSTSTCPVKTITLLNVTGCKHDKALMKYLLGKIACLQCLSIVFKKPCWRKWKYPADTYKELQLLEEVRQFARASPLVNIIVQTWNTISLPESSHHWFEFSRI